MIRRLIVFLLTALAAVAMPLGAGAGSEVIRGLKQLGAIHQRAGAGAPLLEALAAGEVEPAIQAALARAASGRAWTDAQAAELANHPGLEEAIAQLVDHPVLPSLAGTNRATSASPERLATTCVPGSPFAFCEMLTETFAAGARQWLDVGYRATFEGRVHSERRDDRVAALLAQFPPGQVRSLTGKLRQSTPEGQLAGKDDPTVPVTALVSLVKDPRGLDPGALTLTVETLEVGGPNPRTIRLGHEAALTYDFFTTTWRQVYQDEHAFMIAGASKGLVSLTLPLDRALASQFPEASFRSAPLLLDVRPVQ